ncbi:MAG: hypothetical protein GY861_20415 [bacterium]|nr:hypothetical protein [bacterium]
MSQNLNNESISQIIILKVEQQAQKNDNKFKGIIKSNRDIAEEVLGNRRAESTVRRVWKSFKRKGHYRGVVGDSPIAAGTTSAPEDKRRVLEGNKFVITSAQNNTFIHEGFFKSLKNYCKDQDAQLIVSNFYYNKNGFQNGKREDSWFDERIKPYMINESVTLADGLVFCGELNILPTAVNPLSGLHNYTGGQSAIVPHAKLQLESVPTPKYDEAKLMYTTGALTQMNYIQQKSGQKAEWNHSFSALVVEVDEDGDWFVRQLNAESDTGNFYDLGWYYTPEGKDKLPHTVSALQFGDLHVDKLSKEIADMCWGESELSITGTLLPEYIFVHDIHDHSRRNHHNIKDPYFLFKQFTKGQESVEEEVLRTTEVLENLQYHGSKVVVVESNHDLALERWLKEADYKRDPVNAEFFLELQLENYRAIKRGEDLQTFKTACEMVDDSSLTNVRFLKTDEPFRLHGIEMGQHGHNGSGGARGSVQAFQKQGIKFNIGHSHSCNIKDGVYQAGACMEVEDAGYAKGGSSWSVSHIVTYSNGKRAIITCKNGKWKL